jgi:hypothetical protein
MIANELKVCENNSESEILSEINKDEHDHDHDHEHDHPSTITKEDNSLDSFHSDNSIVLTDKINSYKIDIRMKHIKLGKDYKKCKRYFINNYENYIKYIKDDKKLNKIISNVLSRVFDYLDIFLIYDLEDLVHIIFKHNIKNVETNMQIFSYIENIFNEKLYLLLVEKTVKEKYQVLINSKDYLENKDNNIFEEYIHKNALLYIGIIKTEIFKIIMLKVMVTQSVFNNGFNENLLNTRNQLVSSLYELIDKSKRVLLYFYNDLKKNFSFCKAHIEDCKNMIIFNKILI